jgi:hypothetical protein
MNAAASTGSLVQPKPVENSIVLPANPVHAKDAELSLQNYGAVLLCTSTGCRRLTWNNEPTGRANGARPMTSFPVTASGGAGGQDASKGASVVGPESGARWCPPQPTPVIFGR